MQFHNLVEKTLYATKRARSDTCTDVAFLTTRVRAPDLDDWDKMVHMMRYISGSVRVPLMYLIMWTILAKSSRSGAQTLVFKNATAVQMSGLACLVAYKVFSTRL